MGYHKRKIKKGTLGEFSKVEEEWEELLDARSQDGRILELCELADLHGAIAAYVKAAYNLSIEDVAKMAQMTSSAFEDGERGAPPTIILSEQDIFESVQRREKDGKCSWCDNEGEVGPSDDRFACQCGRGDR